MGKRFFSSDFHLGSSLINRYASRPWTGALEAAGALAANVNAKCGRSDVLVHAGDFSLQSADRHGETEDMPPDVSEDEWLSRFAPRVFLLAGNHDDGHNAEAMANNMWVDLGRRWRNVFVSHFPSYHESYRGPSGCKATSAVLCGHVHDKWKYCYDTEKNVLNYNVGVDCHGYAPVEDAEIVRDLDFVFAYADFGAGGFRMTVADEAEWRKSVKATLEEGRARRKDARYNRKGLTPEECARRREAALRAKGLI